MATFARSHKVTTVPGFISALSNRAHTLGHGALPRGELLRRVLRGINNFHADQVPRPKKAITLDDLVAFHGLINHSSFEGARDWCACTLAFFGLLRINEYANGHLRHQDVATDARSVVLTILYSKTSLLPAHVHIASRADVLCPLRAVTAYTAFFKAYTSLPQRRSDPFFVTRRTATSYHPMTDAEFIAVVRTLTQLAAPHSDSSLYAGHSFRRGGTSALKLAGVDDSTIQRHGRWKSDVYRNYIDVDHNIALRLLATQSIPSISSSYPPPSASSSAPRV